jgi:S-adenosylmethionine:tRNA ribosyltransferase-isomerase
VLLNDFNYDLPPELIAQTPANPRCNSRLLVYSRTADKISDRRFYDILDYLNRGDVVVINTTRVRRARLFAVSKTGGKVEIFLHKLLEKDTYEVLLKPARRVRAGDTLTIAYKNEKGENAAQKANGDVVRGVLISKNVEEGTAVMKFDRPVEKCGEIPLPSYIHTQITNDEQYQTTYNDRKKIGSCAAPTAGLHWTPELIERAKTKGVTFCNVVLHVGLGTFRPVKTPDPRDHKMHTEYYEVPRETAEIINRAKQERRRIICVGTTTVRTLESVFLRFKSIQECVGETDIFIYPPYKFNVCDALITNFHLPKSTLLMLVSAFLTREKVLEIYKHAVENEYRFFSFGDCCLFL